MANENELIARAQAGDEQAFAELIRAYYPFVYATVIRIVNNPLDAEEVVQDTFVNVYRGLAQYEEINKFKNWLTKIARNCARNRLRIQHIDTVPIDQVNQQSSGTEDLPDQQLIRSEQRELIRRAMETLSPKDREIARAYYLEGASYDELIQTHGLSYKAISFRLSRAKQRLAKRLRHLLTGVFVTPATTLKQIYSGGLTLMKIGTAPKITVGAIGLVGLLFIGIGVHQIILPKFSGAKDTATSVQSTAPSEELVETDTNQETANRENQPQISDQDMEQINNFFAQLNEADTQSDAGTVQSATDTEVAQDTDENDPTESSTTPSDTTQSAEDVMNTYLDAFRNLDFETIPLFLTGTAREEFESSLPLLNGELPKEIYDIYYNMLPEEEADRALQAMRKMMYPQVKKMLGQLAVVNSGYVGDEFHFRLKLSIQDILVLSSSRAKPGMSGVIPEVSDSLYKMRKEDGVWVIYDTN